MSRHSFAMRLVVLVALLAGLVWFALPARSRQDVTPKRFNQRIQADLMQRDKTRFRSLDAAGRRTAPNEVEVRLTVAMNVHAIAGYMRTGSKDFIRTRSYNGKMCGPVIRVRPGDTLKIQLKNAIARTEWDKEYEEGNHAAPHGFNTTNLHTHGLTVSPGRRADNIFLEVGPEESIDLCFDIPKDHPCGTFWYHAHKHGSVAMQLAGGMAGVLIVEGGTGSLDEDPSIKEATKKDHEKLLVFQQIPYRPDPTGKVVEIKWEDVYAKPEQKLADEKNETLRRPTLINGELLPTIKLRPGEVQRWRCVHGGLEETLALALVKTDDKGKPLDPKDKANRVPLHEIAIDGLPFGRLETWHVQPVELQPGYRSDLLVEAPPPGLYLLMSLPVSEERSFSGFAQAEIHLAYIDVQGAPISPKMTLPKSADLEGYPKKQGLIPIDTVVNPDPIVVKFRPKNATTEKEFWVNGEPFTKERILFRPKLGTAEEWTLNAESGRHPFHVHINPFQVKRKNEAGKEYDIWRDTYFVTDNDEDVTKIRMRFNKFAGKTVLHCHNLRHEDQGMMAAFEVVGTDELPPSCPPVKAGVDAGKAAPNWVLLDRDQKQRKQSEYANKKHLFVLSRGSECVHCRAQVQALIAKAAKFTELGVSVIIVSPIAPMKLPALQGFLALSDEETIAFKDYRCHDGRALHGSFLIDSKGKVYWKDAGDEPYMDVETLLKKAGEMQ